MDILDRIGKKPWLFLLYFTIGYDQKSKVLLLMMNDEARHNNVGSLIGEKVDKE